MREDYFIGPEHDITRINVLQPGDLLTAIRIPNTYAGGKFYFEKVRDRNVWDFPLMNVASAMKLDGGNISDIRIAVNAVSPRPMRLDRGGGRGQGQAGNGGDGRDGRQAGGRGSGSAPVQRLQDSSDAQPG